MTKDDNNRNHSAKYDHRNLMTEIRSIKTEPGRNPWDPGPIDVLYITIFKYDEAGNRIRKTVEKYEGGDPDPVYENTGDNPGWHTVSDEYYVRDVSGKEIAIYSGSSLVLWNIWGLDNVGKINADTTRNYYLKDHLGSIRVVLNSTNQVISAQDYDAWGYPLENRTYNATTMKYDFTGKERDDQTTYDYFGARYYDSRVANWTSIDPLFEKHYDHSPFNYVLRNPIRMIDPDGKQVDITSPMYHINKETGKIQLQVTEFHKDLNYASKKAEPYLKVALNYTRKVALGVMLNEQFGLTKNIPLVSIYKPNLLTFAVLVGTILHVTAPDLNKNEPDYSERNEKDMRSSEIEELYNHYTKTESKGSKKDNNKIGIMPGKAITTIIQNYNKLGF